VQGVALACGAAVVAGAATVTIASAMQDEDEGEVWQDGDKTEDESGREADPLPQDAAAPESEIPNKYEANEAGNAEANVDSEIAEEQDAEEKEEQEQ